MSKILELESFSIRDWSFKNGQDEEERYWFRIMAQIDATLCEVNSEHKVRNHQLNNDYAYVMASSAFSLPKQIKRKFSDSPLSSDMVDMLSELLQIHLAHTRSVFYDISGLAIAKLNGAGEGIYIPLNTTSELRKILIPKLMVDVVPGFPEGA